MNITTRTVEMEPGRSEQLACTQDVCDTLGVVITPTLIVNKLDVKPCFRRKSAYYWTPGDVEVIRQRLVAHLQAL